MTKFTRDRFPHTLEAPQRLYVQWSHDIEWDYSTGLWPTGEEDVFDWEEHFSPISHFYSGREVGEHVWRREKLGSDGIWSAPMYFKGQDGEDGTDGVSIIDVKIVDGVLKFYLSNGDVVDAGEIKEPCEYCWTPESIIDLINAAIESGEIKVDGTCEQCWSTQNILDLVQGGINTGAITLPDNSLWESNNGIVTLKTSEKVRLTKTLHTGQQTPMTSASTLVMNSDGNLQILADADNAINLISSLDSDGDNIQGGSRYSIRVKDGQVINHMQSVSGQGLPIYTHTGVNWTAVGDKLIDVSLDGDNDVWLIEGDTAGGDSDEFIEVAKLSCDIADIPNNSVIYVVYDTTSLSGETVLKLQNEVVGPWFDDYKAAHSGWNGLLKEYTSSLGSPPPYIGEDWLGWSGIPYNEKDDADYTGDIILISFIDESTPIYHEATLPANLDNQPTIEFLDSYDKFINIYYPYYKSFKALVYAIPSSDLAVQGTEVQNHHLCVVAAIEGQNVVNPIPCFSLPDGEITILSNPYSVLSKKLKSYGWSYYVNFTSSTDAITKASFTDDVEAFLANGTESILKLELTRKDGTVITTESAINNCMNLTQVSNNTPTQVVSAGLKSTEDVVVVTQAMLDADPTYLTIPLTNEIAPDSFAITEVENKVLKVDDYDTGRAREVNYNAGDNFVTIDKQALYYDIQPGYEVSVYYFYLSATTGSGDGTNEGGGDGTGTITPPPIPDEIVDLSLYDLSASVNNNGIQIDYDFIIANSGNTAGTTTVDLKLIRQSDGLQFDVTKQHTVTVPAGGQSNQINGQFDNVPAGTYTVTLNNYSTADNVSGSVTDLVIVAPVAEIEYSGFAVIEAGSDYIVTVVATNVGGIAVNNSVYFQLDSGTKKRVGDLHLDIGQSKTYSYTFTILVDGNYVISAYEDDSTTLIDSENFTVGPIYTPAVVPFEDAQQCLFTKEIIPTPVWFIQSPSLVKMVFGYSYSRSSVYRTRYGYDTTGISTASAAVIRYVTSTGDGSIRSVLSAMNDGRCICLLTDVNPPFTASNVWNSGGSINVLDFAELNEQTGVLSIALTGTAVAEINSKDYVGFLFKHVDDQNSTFLYFAQDARSVDLILAY